jgi:bifunctional enzyme CysN/CysC
MSDITFKNDQMNLVVVGHVDHGKSTFIGRLMADTGSLPDGKLEQVKATCAANAKPFEYAFLMDALKDEQAQGITIDIARVFFKSKKRHYIILDAPGHIEFLKNMVTGAARAEAALLLIDAKEGVRENSRRHGYLLSMLGIKQVIVAVNKMDLVDYSQARFDSVEKEYRLFLKEIGVEPMAFVPISAFHGQGLIKAPEKMPWYTGKDVLTLIDECEKEAGKELKPFRLPVQDIYKFTEKDDDRRIVAGTIDTGTISVGDEVVFYPSQKTSTIKSIEGFNTEHKTTLSAGAATGFTLDTQIYTKPGEIMCKVNEQRPLYGYEFKTNIFWLGKNPMILDKRYKIKLGASRQAVYIKKIIKVLDASDLSTTTSKKQIDRHDVAEVVLQTTKPIAFDKISDIEDTGRFVIVDDYEISGGGIVIDLVDDSKSRIEEYIQKREFKWEKGSISHRDRANRYQQNPKLIVITGAEGTQKIDLAKRLEAELFKQGRATYYLGVSNLTMSLSSDQSHKIEDRDAHIRQLGETAHLLTDSGQIVITTISDLDDQEAAILKLLSHPYDLVIINIGESSLTDCVVDLNIKKESSSMDRLNDMLALLLEKSILLSSGNYEI